MDQVRSLSQSSHRVSRPPGGETIHLDLYIFGNAKEPLQKDLEVVIEKFEYLP